MRRNIYKWNLHACVPNRHRTTWHYEVCIKQHANVDFWTQAKYSVYCKAVVVKKYSLKASAGGEGGKRSQLQGGHYYPLHAALRPSQGPDGAIGSR